jgi:hypothetical protein
MSPARGRLPETPWGAARAPHLFPPLDEAYHQWP